MATPKVALQAGLGFRSYEKLSHAETQASDNKERPPNKRRL
jgi:hypothetical protein